METPIFYAVEIDLVMFLMLQLIVKLRSMIIYSYSRYTMLLQSFEAINNSSGLSLRLGWLRHRVFYHQYLTASDDVHKYILAKKVLSPKYLF